MNGWPEPYGLLQTDPRDALWHAAPFSPRMQAADGGRETTVRSA
jgi:hypothetical protein